MALRLHEAAKHRGLHREQTDEADEAPLVFVPEDAGALGSDLEIHPQDQRQEPGDPQTKPATSSPYQCEE